MKLIKKIIITGKVKALTGLHIGGTNSAMGIGGPDSLVVRNPITNRPYIPGSSLKGKMRAMLDISDGSITGNGVHENNTSQNPAHSSVKLFGNAPSSKDTDERGKKFNQMPSRVIVRDGDLISAENLFTNTDLPYTESKTEVVLDRITAKATPRQIERVPAGAEFKLDLVVNVIEGEDEDTQFADLLRAMKMLQDDYLGGSGSRGYGQVELLVEKVEERTNTYYSGQEKTGKLRDDLKDLLNG